MPTIPSVSILFGDVSGKKQRFCLISVQGSSAAVWNLRKKSTEWKKTKQYIRYFVCQITEGH